MTMMVHPAEKYTQEVLRLLITRLGNQSIYRAEYGEKTQNLSYILRPPFDIDNELSDEELQKAADDLLLQIREGTYEKFVELPVPMAVECASITKDRESGLAVRFVRLFDALNGTMLCRFDIGVEA